MKRHYHRPDKVTREVVEAANTLHQFFSWPDYTVLNNWLSELMEKHGPTTHLYVQQYLMDKRLDFMRRGITGRLNHKWACNPGELREIEEGIPWGGYPHLNPKGPGIEKFTFNSATGQWE
jgi:hypothetical protein